MTIRIITDSRDLPQLTFGNFFHSQELFGILERTPGMSPCMVVAVREDGKTIGQLLATIRHRWRFVPFHLLDYGRVYGEGVYEENVEKNVVEKLKVFTCMFDTLMAYLRKHCCTHVEVSDISQKMFGYKCLRSHNFVPIPWSQIHNSLHSKAPEERLSKKTVKRLKKAWDSGITTREAQSDEEIRAFYKLVKGYYRFRKQRYIPNEKLFQLIGASANGHIFVTLYKDKIIGGSVIVDSGKESMLWFETSLKKRYALFYPHYATIWCALKEMYAIGQDHLHFLNIGLPFNHSQYRDFILSFGGKPVSSYRWFRFSYSWLNKLLFWIYRI